MAFPKTTSNAYLAPVYQPAPKPPPVVHKTTSIQCTDGPCIYDDGYERLNELNILPTQTTSDPRVTVPPKCPAGPCVVCPTPYARTYSNPNLDEYGPGPAKICKLKQTKAACHRCYRITPTTHCAENAKPKYVYEVDLDSEDFQRYGSPVDPPIIKDDTYPILLLQDSHLLKTRRRKTLRWEHWDEIDDPSLHDVSYKRPYSDLPTMEPYMEHIRQRVKISELKKRTYKEDFHFAPESSRPKRHELYIPPLLFVNQDAHNSTFIGYKPFPFKLHFEKYNPRPPPFLVSDGRLIVDVQRDLILPITADTHATDFTLDY